MVAFHRIMHSHLPLVAFLIDTTLLGYHNIFHLLDWDSTLHVDPLVLNDMLLPKFEHKINTTNVTVGDKSKASGLVSALVL